MSCKTILPKNIDEKLNVLDLVGCERLEEIKQTILKISDFNNPLKIDENFLPLMVDEYEAEFFTDFESNLRELVKFAQNSYPKLGTIQAIKKVFEAIGVEAKLEEWFEYDGEPYHFKIKVDAVKDEESWIKGIQLLNKVKNVRSVLDSVGIDTDINTTIYRASAFKQGQKANIYLKINPNVSDTNLSYGFAKRDAISVQIGVNIPQIKVNLSNNYVANYLQVGNKIGIGVNNG